MTDRQRAVAFLRETYRRRVERVETHPWGELVVTPSLPRVWDANFALVDRWDGSDAALGRELEQIQRERGFVHRKIVAYDRENIRRLQPTFTQQDWKNCWHPLLMVQTREPDRPADPGVRVTMIDADDWASARRRMIELEGYSSEPDVVRQVLALDGRLAAAMDVRYLAVIVSDNVAAYAGLYLESGVAQIEEVATLPEYRGRGLGRAIVLHALAEGRHAGADFVFLVADDENWPKELYGRLGFDPVGVGLSLGHPSGHAYVP